MIILYRLTIALLLVITDHKFKDGEGYVIGSGAMHTDSERIIQLFDQYQNIKLCLSGHIHLYEQIVYNGITYICNGAVCGNSWKGIRHKTDNGYALINLYDDGSFSNDYINYGWQVQ